MSDHACCSEYNCRRKQPILVRPEPFGGGWVAVTKYRKRGENGIVAAEKHRLDPVSQAEIELNGPVLRDLFEHVKNQYARAEDDSDAEGAYRNVLDKIAELTEARKTALLGTPAAVSSAVPGEPTEVGPADRGATGKPAKVEVEHVMDDPNMPDWGGEETDEGTPIYHAAWDSQDGSARVWAGPYAGGLTDGWALSVEAETASVLLRCSTDQLIDWAESVRKAIEDSRANLQYVERYGSDRA